LPEKARPRNRRPSPERRRSARGSVCPRPLRRPTGAGHRAARL